MNYFKQINESFDRLQKNVLKEENEQVTVNKPKLNEMARDSQIRRGERVIIKPTKATYNDLMDDQEREDLRKLKGKTGVITGYTWEPGDRYRRGRYLIYVKMDDTGEQWNFVAGDLVLTGENVLYNESLDEALPKDLMRGIRSAHSEHSYNDFNSGNLYNQWDSKTGDYTKPATNVLDYDKATYREVTPDEVKAMKKAGQSLDKVYIMKNGSLYKLDKEGHPDNYYSDRDSRANQSVNKSLEGADKIYIADIPNLMDSQPEKVFSRMSNDELRSSNLKLGHDRPSNSDNTRGGSDYIKSKRQQGGNKAKINAIKAQYDAGDISRKEMEKQISYLKGRTFAPHDYYVQKYNSIRDTNAESRYKASELALQKPFQDLNTYRYEINKAKSKLERNRKELDAIKSGTADKYTGGLYDYNYNKVELENQKKELLKLQKQIAYTQKEIDRLSKLVNSDAKQAEIDKYQKNIEDNISQINSAQNNIDKLLRRK